MQLNRLIARLEELKTSGEISGDAEVIFEGAEGGIESVDVYFGMVKLEGGYAWE